MAESPQNIRYRQIRTGDRHGTSKTIQMSDGLGLDPFLAKYNTEGSVTPSTLNANDVLTSPGGGTGATTGGLGSPYEQIPNGAMNGVNVDFYLDYIPSSPPTGTPPVVPFWLNLNGLGQTPYPPNARYTLAPGSNHLVMSKAPKATDEFWCQYFRGPLAPVPSTAVSAVVHVVYSYTHGTPALSNHGIVQLSDAVYFAQIFDSTEYTLVDKTITFSPLPAGFGTGDFAQNLSVFHSIFFDLDTPDVLRIYDYYANVTYADGTTARIYPTVAGVPGTGGGGISFDVTHATGNGSVVTYSVGFPNNNPPSDLAPGMLLRTIDFPTAGFNVTGAVITSTSLSVTSPAPAFGSGYYVTGTITINNSTIGNENWPATERNGSATNAGYYGSFANISAAVDGNPATYATIQSQHYFPTRGGSSINFTF